MSIDGGDFHLRAQQSSLAGDTEFQDLFQSLLQDLVGKSSGETNFETAPASDRSSEPANGSFLQQIQQGAGLKQHQTQPQQNPTPQTSILEQIRAAAYQKRPASKANATNDKDVAGMGAPQLNQNDLTLQDITTSSGFSESSTSEQPGISVAGQGPTVIYNILIDKYVVQGSSKNKNTQKAGSDKI